MHVLYYLAEHHCDIGLARSREQDVKHEKEWILDCNSISVGVGLAIDRLSILQL